MGKTRLWGKWSEKEFTFGHIKFELPFVCQSGDVIEATGYEFAL